MIVERNGVRIDANVQGRTFTFRVLEQSKEATKVLRLLGHVRDEETGITLRSNQSPSFNRKIKRMFIRGSNKADHEKAVSVEMKTVADAQAALAALPRLLDQLQEPAELQAEPGHIIIGTANVIPGGTSHVRMTFINRAMAQHLELTGHDHYPDEVVPWQPTRPVFTNNRHYNEHIGQVVDVLNKSVSNKVNTNKIINPHKVTPKQARDAVQAVRQLFIDAQNGGYLTAIWRTVTGLRGPDFED